MKRIETGPNNKRDGLMTRYYQNDFIKVKEALLNISKKNSYTIIHCDDTFQEMLIESTLFTTIVKVSYISAFESAVDFTITSKMLFKKPIEHSLFLYSELNKSLQYISKGLNRNG